MQLRIQDGEVQLGSTLGPGFGHDVVPDLGARRQVACVRGGELT